MKKIITSFLALTLFLSTAASVSAQRASDLVRDGLEQARQQQDGDGGITNPAIGELGSSAEAAASGSLFQQYFVTLWQALISVGALLVLVYFLWGGIEWISAGGDSGKVQKARDKITQAIVGLIVLVGTFAIITWISGIFFGEEFSILELQFANQTQQVQNSGNARVN